MSADRARPFNIPTKTDDAKTDDAKTDVIEIDECLTLHDFSEVKCALLNQGSFYLVYKDLNRRAYRISAPFWFDKERLMALFKQHGLPIMKSKEEYVSTFGTTTDV